METNTTSQPAPATTAPAVPEESAAPSTVTPINRAAKRRARRRMAFALFLVIVGVVAWRVSGVSDTKDNLAPAAPAVGAPASTPQEALAQLREPTATVPASTKLKAGVIAAQNYYTAMGTYDGFVFPGATVVSGDKGTVLIVQDGGSCFTRTLTDGTTTEVTNDPESCTTKGQLAIKESLS